MKKNKIFLFILAFMIIMGYNIENSVLKTEAKVSFEELERQYPSMSYWNYDYKGKAWECHGFALTIADKYTDTDPYTWPKAYNFNSLKPGDIIRFNRPHSILVTNVQGNTVEYVDCNWYKAKTVKWHQTIQKSSLISKFGSLSAVWVSPDIQVNNPIGHVDSISGGKKTISVRGWAFDKDSLATSIDIHVYIGGPAGSAEAEGHVITANTNRPDVNNAYSGVGDLHGFEQEVSTNKIGNQDVYVYAINVGQGNNIMIGSGTVNIQDCNTPVGFLDSVVGGDETICIKGWAFDGDVPGESLDVHIYVGGPAGDKNAVCYVIRANKERVDVGNTYPGVGNYHGYNDTINVNKIGVQDVYVYAINSGGGVENPCIGKTTVSINKKIVPVSSLAVTRYGTVNGEGYCINTAADFELGVKVQPENATNKEVIWSSSDGSIAEVDQSGHVTGKKNGTVYITATSKYGKCSANALVKVVSGDIIYGDINYDGKITITDYSQMILAVNGAYELSDAEFEIFDLNVDGIVNEDDRELLKQFVIGEITVFPVEQSISKLVIEKMPDKTEFFVGDKISAEGLVLKAYYCDGTSKILTDYDVIGDTSESGEKTIILSYTEGIVTRKASYKINVIKNKLSKIKITVSPDKVEYIEGDCFSPLGIKVKAFYLDGSSKLVNKIDYDKKDALSCTDDKICIFYSEDGVVCYDYQSVKVQSICEKYGHNWSKYEYLGNDTHCKVCTVCGKEESEACCNEILKIQPTCMREGYTEKYCSVCWHREVSELKEKLEHTWDAGKVIQEPSSIKNGIRKYTCLVCGETYEEDIPATGEIETTKESETTKASETPTVRETTTKTSESLIVRETTTKAPETTTVRETTTNAPEPTTEESTEKPTTQKKISLSECEIYGIEDKIYTGEPIEQDISVYYEGDEISVDVTYYNNVNVGTATVVIKGIENFKGSIVKKFKITKDTRDFDTYTETEYVDYTALKKKNIKLYSPIIVDGDEIDEDEDVITYKNLSTGLSSRFKINKNTGVVTVRKGTKKGNYKLRIKVTLKGNDRYKTVSEKVTLKIKVV